MARNKPAIWTMISTELLPPGGKRPKTRINICIEDPDYPEYPVWIVRGVVPEGFPKKLIPKLADFMYQGFHGALAQRELIDELHAKPSGRPVDPAVQLIGQRAAKLRTDRNLSWGQIARALCKQNGVPGHDCRRSRCADRIRQSAKRYLAAKASQVPYEETRR